MQDKIRPVIGHCDRDGFETTIDKLMVEPNQSWHLTDTDHAAGGPKVHQHDFASQACLAQALSVDQRIDDLRRPLSCVPEAPAH
jgi:hypothetical protein